MELIFITSFLLHIIEAKISVISYTHCHPYWQECPFIVTVPQLLSKNWEQKTSIVSSQRLRYQSPNYTGTTSEVSPNPMSWKDENRISQWVSFIDFLLQSLIRKRKWLFVWLKDVTISNQISFFFNPALWNSFNLNVGRCVRRFWCAS